MSTTEQDDNRTAGHPLTTLTQQGGLSQLKASMKTREQSQPSAGQTITSKLAKNEVLSGKLFSAKQLMKV